jgi:Kef-type K+ transport system membrane component KefB
MPDGSFVAVAVVAFTAPLLRELVPALIVPAVVLELLGGILIGPHVLDIAQSTEAVELFSTIGLAALLFLAGREIDVALLRGPLLKRATGSFIAAFAIGTVIGGVLYALELVEAPLLIAVILVATSLSVIIVPLRDAGETETRFGQAVIATAAVAEFGAVILLSFLFSTEREGFETEVVHLIAFGLATVVVFLVLTQGRRVGRLRAAMERLQEGSAQIRVRGDFALLAIVVGFAVELGLESILAAFAVGVIRGMTSPSKEDEAGLEAAKIDAIALGIFVPFFFVGSGINFRVDELTGSAEALLLVPAFVIAFLAVHMIPAVALAGAERRYSIAEGLLTATSLSFVIVATQIGLELEIIAPDTATALVGAGLATVIIFPALALRRIKSAEAG